MKFGKLIQTTRSLLRSGKSGSINQLMIENVNKRFIQTCKSMYNLIQEQYAHQNGKFNC